MRSLPAIAIIAAVAVAGSVFAAVSVTTAAAAPQMTPHKALYSFRMVSMEQGSAVTGINGQMYFEQDDACDAWTTDQRFTTEYHYPERRPLTNTSRYVGWEAKDGSLFHYSSEKQEDTEMAEQLRGSVERRADGSATAQYSRPEKLSFELPAGYTLPMMHTIETIKRAHAGDKFFTAILFDGTDEEGPVEISTFVTGKVDIANVKKKIPDMEKIDAGLLGSPAWMVRMAFFPLADKDNSTPAYEMDSILHENGVISWALVDYKTFKVEQTISALEKLPLKNCP